MPWVKIDDKWSNHPKLVTVGPLGKALFMDALCYASQYLTDGFIPYLVADQLSYQFQDLMEVGAIDNIREPIKWLCAQDLWEEDKEARGYWIHDYLEFNPSKAQVEGEREAARERMNRARGKQATVQENTEQRSEDVHPKFSRSSHNPVPVPVSSSSNDSELSKPPLVPQTRKSRSRASPDLEGFDDWYSHYPRKEKRPAAETAWSKLKPDEREAAILAIQDQVHWPSMSDPQYIPHPSTWLNNRRWGDERPKGLGPTLPPGWTQAKMDEALAYRSAHMSMPPEREAAVDAYLAAMKGAAA